MASFYDHHESLQVATMLTSAAARWRCRLLGNLPAAAATRQGRRCQPCRWASTAIDRLDHHRCQPHWMLMLRQPHWMLMLRQPHWMLMLRQPSMLPMPCCCLSQFVRRVSSSHAPQIASCAWIASVARRPHRSHDLTKPGSPNLGCDLEQKQQRMAVTGCCRPRQEGEHVCTCEEPMCSAAIEAGDTCARSRASCLHSSLPRLLLHVLGPPRIGHLPQLSSFESVTCAQVPCLLACSTGLLTAQALLKDYGEGRCRVLRRNSLHR